MRRRAGLRRSPGATVGRKVVFEIAPGGSVVLARGSVVGDRCRFQAGPGAVIEVHGTLDEGCRVSAGAAITVGAGARLGTECVLIDSDPVFADPERPVREQGTTSTPVHVGAGALLGPGVAVLRGVTIGAGATVLAHSVVTRDVAPGAQVAGTPAHGPRVKRV